MATRAVLPNVFLYRGYLLPVALEDGESLAGQTTRLRFLMAEYDRYAAAGHTAQFGEDYGELIRQSREYSNERLLGAGYAGSTPVQRLREDESTDADAGQDENADADADESESRAVSAAKADAAAAKLDELTAYRDQQPLSFLRYMQWLANFAYIVQMEESPRYTVADLVAFDVPYHFEDDLILDFEEALSLFYEIEAPDRAPDAERIARLGARYRGHYPVLFQRLYRNYVDPAYAVVPGAYDDELFIQY